MNGRNTATLVLLLLIAAIANGCGSSNSNPSNSGNNSGSGTLFVHIYTNGGGPSIKPLPGATVKIEKTTGALVMQATSDSSGNFTVDLPAASYKLDPQEIPDPPNFYHAPPASEVTITQGSLLRDTLYYWNPMVVAGSSGDSHK